MTIPATAAAPAESTAKLPRQIPYIIGNEGCERFSFYGMRNILVQFLASSVLLAYLPEGRARRHGQGGVPHLRHRRVLLPAAGRLARRTASSASTSTVLWFSLIYCAGHACLALFEGNRTGFYTGLFLIALGSGGIKPLVVSFVGDQFDQSNKHLARKVFDAFYWIINFGSFFASLLMPIFLRNYGPAVAFGIPGVADVHRHLHLLARPQAVRQRAADARRTRTPSCTWRAPRCWRSRRGRAVRA